MLQKFGMRLSFGVIHTFCLCRRSQNEEELEDLESTLESYEAISREVITRHKRQLAAHHTFFHPVWGQLLKTGYQNSKYAHLLERFACLYTSHVSNLAFYSPTKKFRGRVDVMAHEEVLPEGSSALGAEVQIKTRAEERQLL